ncbi:nose resistant to fluoxetine protein 6-like [Leptidea sinapis]|uniref:nose resistant to fluoxetine protein 6-like n=1 Tax=Leptidea sinapis TaxID=189913 RepID=UPI00211FA9F2|nr:nose resistant to fluoxetine protein 6-like [Leptidea sinapis]
MYFFLLVFIVHPCASVIFNINDTEYRRMPPLYHLDDYHECLASPGGLYCIADFDLFARRPSELMHFIQEYSADTRKHFNHTQIHRGVCFTSTCQANQLNNLNETTDVKAPLEACINQTIWPKYGLETKISKLSYCKRSGDTRHVDWVDIMFAVFCVLVLLINVVGTTYDIVTSTRDSKQGNKYLLAFSIKKNWSKLVAPSGIGPEPRLERLKSINAIRTLTMVCVVLSHTILMAVFSYVENPHKVEEGYGKPEMFLVYNGTLTTCTFFMLSGFLLTYNFVIYTETHRVSYSYILNGLLLRWIRLTPSYALVLGLLATWMRFAGDGPLWDYVVTYESTACRSYWWAHLLYINNYIYDRDQCAPQSWYLAADTQLFCIGLVVLVVARGRRARNWAVLGLVGLAFIIVAATTYLRDLDAVVIQTPESYRVLYLFTRTFFYVYIPGHTNLSSYTVGMGAALLAHHWQKEKKDFTKYQKYRWVYMLVLPVGVAVLLSGALFYVDGVVWPRWFRALFAATHRPVFQGLVALLMLGSIFKIENVYRGVLEWRGFTWTGRTTYSVFLLHPIFERLFSGIQTTPVRITELHMTLLLAGTLFLSFATGALLFTIVEAPLSNVIRICLAPPSPPLTAKDETEEK